jgi:hypothetical protein
MTLDEIAIKHGTDKSSRCHNYTVLYEQMFGAAREEPLKILEIGVAEGASLRMWCDFFPNAEIHGIDVNPDCKVFADNRITIHIGKQGDKDFLDSIGIDFDIVIDDGSHQVSDQIFTFKCLWPNTKMVYIVEDVYSSYIGRYGGGYRRAGTAIEFFKDLVDDLNAPRLYSMYKSRGIHVDYKNIGTIQFYPSLVCIYKGK